uniref:Uncharacterized protein n=1 Tax=Lepeophtheirus salmonis TaxID=72036 RepID=A0A0K2V6D4_LEPSM
MVVNFVLLPY